MSSKIYQNLHFTFNDYRVLKAKIEKCFFIPTVSQKKQINVSMKIKET